MENALSVITNILNEFKFKIKNNIEIHDVKCEETTELITINLFDNKLVRFCVDVPIIFSRTCNILSKTKICRGDFDIFFGIKNNMNYDIKIKFFIDSNVVKEFVLKSKETNWICEGHYVPLFCFIYSNFYIELEMFEQCDANEISLTLYGSFLQNVDRYNLKSNFLYFNLQNDTSIYVANGLCGIVPTIKKTNFN